MKFNRLITRLSFWVCSFAFWVAVNSIDKMCTGSFYQPKVPLSLEKHRK